MLVVSRPDISSTELQEFDLTQRFIKLPVKPYLELVGAASQLNRPQRALINALNSPNYRFICAALARRLGKTYIANIVAQLVLLVPGCNVLIISPNYNLSSISFELQRRLVKHFDLEVTRDNLKDKVLELENGSTIRMGSISTVDSSVGRSYDLIVFDEAALAEGGEEAFNVALRPTLDKPGAKAVFISTPRGKNNWFSKFWARGFDPNFPQWISLQADWTENPRMTEADVLEAKSAMSRQEFEQEYCASFTEFVGQIFRLESSTQVLEFAPGNDYVEFFAGCDPGFRDPTAFVAVAYLPQLNAYWVVAEYERSEVTTAEHAEAILEIIQQFKIETVFIDSAAQQFSSDLAYLYDIPTVNAKKAVLPGIAFVQTVVETNRLFVDPSCVKTLAMLDQYRWDTSTNATREKPQHDQYSHLADALRYALYSFIV